MRTSSATTSSSGRVASSSCVQLARSSGSTSARSSRIVARSSSDLPKAFVVRVAIRSSSGA
jgi:hypothetical protein